MDMKDKEITLKLNSRPLKLAYLVRTSEDLFNSISLYTHLSGGAANYILPLPDNNDEMVDLKNSLQNIDPDYILIPDNEKLLTDLGNQLSAPQRKISYSAIQSHINGHDLYRFPSGDLNHIIPVISALFQDGINRQIGLVAPSSDIATALNYGLPTQNYRQYLCTKYGASIFRRPSNMQEEIQLKLTVSRKSSLFDLTLAKISRKWNGLDSEITETNDPETLCLFLGNEHDIDVCTAFWNTRWIYSRNKIFLNKETFLIDISSYINLITEGMPLVRAVAVFVKSSYEEAKDIYHAIKQSFSSTDRNLCVRVQYSGLKYKFSHGKLSFDEPNTFTRQIYLDSSVRFTPNPPLGHGKDMLFGFDAEVTFSSGFNLSLPSTNKMSELLSNEIERLKWIEDHGSAFHRKESIVRSADKGITGITKGGLECRLYIHPNDIFVNNHLKAFGFEVRLNKLTQYAQGFIKKLGGLNKARKLVAEGGLRIISVLNDTKAYEAGLEIGKMKGGLSTVLNNEQAQDLISNYLPEMLASGLVRRGYPLTCTHCDLKAWYSIEIIREFIECVGCAESFQLKIEKIPFAYKPNELASRFLKEGGQAVLTTANVLYQIDRSALLTFGGDLLKIGEKKNFAEADLLWLSRDIFAIAECKCRYNKLDDMEEIRVSLTKNLETAVQIGAQVVFLGIYTNLEDNEVLFDLVRSLSEYSKEKKVALHLIINSDLYLWGEKEKKVTEILDMSNLRLLLEHKDYFEYLEKIAWFKNDHSHFLSGCEPCIPLPNPDIAIGEKPASYGGNWGTENIYDSEILSIWEESFLISQES